MLRFSSSPGASRGIPRSTAVSTTLPDAPRQAVGHLHVGGVDRLLGRREQAHGAVAGAAALTLVAELGAGDLERRAAVERRLEREAVAQGGREGERLEGRPRGAAGDGPVELAVEIVLAGVHPPQGPGLGVHRGDGDVQLLEVGPLGENTGAGRVHRLLGEGGGDAQAAAVDLGVAEPEPSQLVADQLQHVAALAAVLALGLDLRELRQPLGARGAAQLRREHARLVHAADHVAVPRGERLLRGLAVGGVVAVGRVDDRGEGGALLDVQLLRRGAEVGAGGGLDAVGPPPEVDRVEVPLEDLLLLHLPLDLEGEDRLLGLAGPGAVLAEVEDLDVLLGDRRGALGVAAGRVVERRPEDPLGVEPLVGPERAVLRGDDGVLDVVGDLAQLDAGAVLLGELPEDRLAVGVVDIARLGLEPLVRVRDVGSGVGDGEQHEPEDEDGAADDAEPLGPQAPAARPLPAGRARLAGPAGVPGRAGLPRRPVPLGPRAGFSALSAHE